MRNNYFRKILAGGRSVTIRYLNAVRVVYEDGSLYNSKKGGCEGDDFLRIKP